MAKSLNVPIAWFRAEDYAHIRQISDGGLPPTFTEWEAKMIQTIARSAAAGILGEKVIIRPDELLAFARQIHARKIDNQVRNRFATLKLLGKQPTSRVNAAVSNRTYR